MKEKLIIRNFGPIKNVELELGRFNVLIGEQATGKSTVAKVLAVCRYFSYITNFDYFEKNGSSFTWGLISWGLDEYIKPDTYFFYSCKDYEFEGRANKLPFDRWVSQEINNSTLNIDIKLEAISPNFKKIINELKKINNNSNNYSFSNTPTSFFQNEVKKVMDNPFYLPTERGLQSIFSLGKSSIRNIADSLFDQFADIDRIVRFFKKDTRIEPLNIIYKNFDGQGFVRKNSEESFYSLYNAASGYQSTIPVVLLIKYYTEIKRKNKTFIIEEPELNLFPSAQNELVKFMADKTLNYGNSIFLNTHSPYILTSLNSLISAFNAGKEHGDEVEKIIERKYWLNPDDVSAYMMLPDGTCEDIFDREENLIHAEKIDGVSRILNQQFDEILNIEFAGK